MKKTFRNQLARIVAALPNSKARTRRKLARAYLSGVGLEIGALHNPLKVPSCARVTYLDRMTESQLRQQYPELSNEPLVPVQIVDDGETLATVRDESMDFVIANHIFEHSENPLLTLKNWLRVLRKNGILYLAIPNKEKTFDRDRPITSIDHIVRDYEDGPATSRRHHFEEWVVWVDKAPPERVTQEVERLLAMSYSIHYHVWNPPAFLELLRFCQTVRSYPFQIERAAIVGNEVIAIVKKTA